jgi:hypothetical protein
VSTVIGHLARYVDSGQIPIDSLIDSQHRQAIERIVRMVGTLENTAAIKSLCPADITYDEIRLVLSMMKQK